MKIKLSKYFENVAHEFATARMQGSKKLYEYRGEMCENKMWQDIVIGVMGEFAVYQYLKSQNVITSKPDLNIYPGRRKSFDADLFNAEIDVHVKSQGVKSAERYGNSWLLQRSDKVVSDPAANEFFAFTNVDGREVEILGIVKCQDILKKGLFDECRVPRYRHTKVALYFDHIKEVLNKKQLWRL